MKMRQGVLHVGLLVLLLTNLMVAIPSFAQTVVPTFEVSTVKVNNSGSGSSRSNTNNGRFEASNVSLKRLIHYQAYGVPDARIVGVPKWADTARFDIEAKMDAATQTQIQALSSEQRTLARRAMFQQLLADRFKLAVHWETREMPVYAMVVAKGEPKLHASTSTSSGTGSGNGMMNGKKLTMEELAQELTQTLEGELGRIVVDKTGLSGSYDFELKWTPANGAAGDPAVDAGPSIFTAMQEQLGLKLEPAKGPVQVLVIDHVEMPTEN